MGSVGNAFKGTINKLFILDGAITGLMTERTGSEDLNRPKKSVTPVGKYSASGRYRDGKRDGWGGTIVQSAKGDIASIDYDITWVEMTILVTEPNMERLALLQVTEQKSIEAM